MSATKARRKWAKDAPDADLEMAARELDRDADGTRNMAFKSSLREQADICRQELKRRQKLATA